MCCIPTDNIQPDGSSFSSSNQLDTIDERSLSLLLTVAKDEFYHADEQYKNIDGRVSIFLTLQAGLMVFFSSTNFQTINKLTFINKAEFYAAAFKFLVPLGALVLMAISVVYFIRILTIRTYQRIEMDGFSSDEVTSLCHERVEYIYLTLISEYAKNAINNRKVNEAKQKYYTIALRYTIASIITLTAMYIANGMF